MRDHRVLLAAAMVLASGKAPPALRPWAERDSHDGEPTGAERAREYAAKTEREAEFIRQAQAKRDRKNAARLAQTKDRR